MLVETTRHVASPGSFEVTVTAMLGGKPSPRQLTSFGFGSKTGADRCVRSRV
jgi:hypothetical protein